MFGYSGPTDQKSIDQFLASNPAAAARMGKYQETMNKMVSGKPIRGFQEGGVVAAPHRQPYVGPLNLTPEQVSALPTNQLLDYNRQVREQSSQTLEDIYSSNIIPRPETGLFSSPALTPEQQQLQQLQGGLQDLALQSGQPIRRPEVTQIDPTTGMLSPTAGQVTTPAPVVASQAASAQTVATPTPTPASLIEAATVAPQVQQAVSGLQPAQGVVSPEAQVQAAQGQLSPGAMAEAAKFDPQYLQLVAASNLPVTAEQLVVAQGQDEVAVSSKIAQSAGIDPAVAAQGVVSQNELPQPAQIAESEMAQAQAIISGGRLSQDATAVAAKLKSFNVDNGTLAEAAQGNVNAQDTVQGQLASLMRQFDDGTPAWAAGAVRAANAVMAARGLGGSSMAGAAILQAAMESALPIAAQDAQTFAQMNLSNLDRRQQVSLTNAAAQQGLALQNLNNEQQAALQNSANAFQLQSQDLSNMQQTVLANAQIKAALQGQNLNNRQQANLAVAARYAEVADMNLNNRQQTALQNNMNTLQVELANLSNRQQSYIANAQLEAALQSKQIDTRQQAAIANAARFSEAANIQFSAEQQAKLHNSQLVSTIGLQELNNRQAATLQNAAQTAAMDMTNLNNRQQSAVQNAQAFLQMDLTNLSNQQQTELFKTQQITQSLFSDQAAQNAAAQFNASSENQTNQFFESLSAQVSQFNTSQSNAMNQFNAGQENAVAQFNAQLDNQRDMFNAQNSLIIEQANAQWRQNVTTLNTAAQNEANMDFAKTLNALSSATLANIWQRERDNMNFAFTAEQSGLDRQLSILLGDKQLEEVRRQIAGRDETFKTAFFTDLLFGGSSSSNRSGNVFDILGRN
jgi:hypothetical protein